MNHLLPYVDHYPTRQYWRTFNEQKATEIHVDASPVGLGAILSQRDANGEHQSVIAYGSRSCINSS